MSNFGGAGGAEYEFITQDHATSIQMKLAWRAYLERNISRSPDFICLDMSSAHRKTRLAWLSGKSAAAPRPAPRRAGTHRTHSTKCTMKIKLHSQSRWSHTQCGAGPRPRPSRLEPAKNSFYITNICAGKRESPLGVQGALEAKSPDPLHERGFHLYSQTGRLSREERAERERESCLDT